MSAGQFFQWHDLFVVVDDGNVSLSQYDKIEAAMKKQIEQYASIGCLVILPPGARPPPADVQARVKTLLTKLAPSLSSLGYLIEGTGFKAVSARAALVGMKIFTTRPYPIYVETSMPAVIQKMLPGLKKAGSVTTDTDVVVKALADARNKAAEPQPVRA